MSPPQHSPLCRLLPLAALPAAGSSQPGSQARQSQPLGCLLAIRRAASSHLLPLSDLPRPVFPSLITSPASLPLPTAETAEMPSPAMISLVHYGRGVPGMGSVLFHTPVQQNHCSYRSFGTGEVTCSRRSNFHWKDVTEEPSWPEPNLPAGICKQPQLLLIVGLLIEFGKCISLNAPVCHSK